MTDDRGARFDARRRALIRGGAALLAGVSLHGRAAHSPKKALSVFRPGGLWLDTAGKPIQAHGGSVLEVEERCYWYGENKEFTTGKGDIWTWGIRAYESTDLYHWQDIGLIVPPNTEDRSSPLHPAAGLDRPHILYNHVTRKFVCWFKQLKGAHQSLTVLEGDAFAGPYRLLRTGIRPFGMDAGDFDLCVSPHDGKAYLYFERVHSELICADLTEDYTDFTGYYTTHFPHASPPTVREGICYFARNHKHYLITSGTTGYFPNPSQVAIADNFHGPFTVLGDLHPGDRSRTSVNSQASCVFKHPRKKDLFIAVCDRWMGDETSAYFKSGAMSRVAQSAVAKTFQRPPGVLTPEEERLLKSLEELNTSRSRYVWLPLKFDGERPLVEWRDSWSLDEFE